MSHIGLSTCAFLKGKASQILKLLHIRFTLANNNMSSIFNIFHCHVGGAVVVRKHHEFFAIVSYSPGLRKFI